MQGISWRCPGAWWITASVVTMILMIGVLLRWRRHQALRSSRSRAEDIANAAAARSMQEFMLQSGQGLILRFEAIARQLPPDHPTRLDLIAAIDRAESVLEKGLDSAQHRRDGMAPSMPTPDNDPLS
ncbi:hypothetical protein [Rhodanobacter sp. L36]|uniref:hypothetical protein n=1 Tax=Rhodanobacter sp. L36 TaxID=1747221 RepID=UPI00131CB630|nr:hypothetical protein [Rhodanobacter sp. L36]